MSKGGVPFTHVVVDASQIHDWDSFHTVFAKAFGFPHFYGRNMDAWIDCMTDEGMTKIHAPDGGVVVLDLQHARDFAARCPDVYAALVECAAFVNYRRIEMGDGPALCLSSR